MYFIDTLSQYIFTENHKLIYNSCFYWMKNKSMNYIHFFTFHNAFRKVFYIQLRSGNYYTSIMKWLFHKSIAELYGSELRPLVQL